jgi:hypothetical protein
MTTVGLAQDDSVQLVRPPTHAQRTRMNGAPQARPSKLGRGTQDVYIPPFAQDAKDGAPGTLTPPMRGETAHEWGTPIGCEWFI